VAGALSHIEEDCTMDDEPIEECPICEGAGCSECDGSPLTDEEIEEQSD
jgi:hypothetical protein